MNAQGIIDLATFTELKDLMGADFIVELIDTYLTECGELLASLRQALSVEDAVTFGRLAHSIKSSSASLGALVFAQQARELEMIGKAGVLTGAGPKVDRLATDYLDVQRCLEELKHGP